MQIRLGVIYGVVIGLLVGVVGAVPLLNGDIIDDIFKQNKIYMIYVTQDNDIMMEAYLNEYCYDNRLCAVLNKMSDRFVDVYNYVGREQLQYFLIIDAARKLKYIMPIIDGMTANDLFIFHSKFEQGLLQPFYASEKPQKDPYLPCRKVVGQNLDSFLSHHAPIKVLYLYSDQANHCEYCGETLRNYADFAEKNYDEKTIIFGYFHVLKNDHPAIKDEIHPYFLIFTDRQNQQPYGVPGDSIQKLQQKIIEMITTNKKVHFDPHPSDPKIEPSLQQL